MIKVINKIENTTKIIGLVLDSKLASQDSPEWSTNIRLPSKWQIFRFATQLERWIAIMEQTCSAITALTLFTKFNKETQTLTRKHKHFVKDTKWKQISYPIWCRLIYFLRHQPSTWAWPQQKAVTPSAGTWNNCLKWNYCRSKWGQTLLANMRSHFV